MLIGTIPYMSPNRRWERRFDHRSDIWSLGVVLFEMLTGHLPFQGENALKVIHGILNSPVPEMPAVAPALRAVVQKSLAKQPVDRYENASALVEELEAMLSRSDVAATRAFSA